jgi:hypothetical protein
MVRRLKQTREWTAAASVGVGIHPIAVDDQLEGDHGLRIRRRQPPPNGFWFIPGAAHQPGGAGQGFAAFGAGLAKGVSCRVVREFALLLVKCR